MEDEVLSAAQELFAYKRLREALAMISGNLPDLELAAASPRSRHLAAIHLLARIHMELRQYDHACRCLQNLVGTPLPQDDIFLLLADCLARTGRESEALVWQRKAVLSGSNHWRLALTRASRSMTAGNYAKALRQLQQVLTKQPDNHEAWWRWLLALHYCPDSTPRAQLYNEHLRFARFCEAPVLKGQATPANAAGSSPHSKSESKFVAPPQTPEAHITPTVDSLSSRPPDPEMSPDSRTHLAFLSPDFRQHSCLHFLLPLITNLPRDRFKVHAYSDAGKLFTDSWTGLVRSSVDEFRDISSLDDETVCDYLASDKIDILIDCAGHTQNNRLLLFARKPVPVQITWLGYPDTTGLCSMDYRITDAVIDPPDDPLSAQYSTERLVHLPHGIHCYDPLCPWPATGRHPVSAQGEIVFGSFNNTLKLDHETLELWRDILLATPESRLIIKAPNLRNEKGYTFCQERFSNTGFPMERVELCHSEPQRLQHLAHYRRVDIALDPLPYNGVTTSCEALMHGIPVVTRRGRRPSSRLGASLLTSLGRTEWIAESSEQYRSIVSDLVQHLIRLGGARDAFRRQTARQFVTSPICDPEGFSQSFAQLLSSLVNREDSML